MRPRRFALAVSAALLLDLGAGCGGAPPPPAVASPEVKPSATPTAPPDLSAVPDPKGLVLFGRIKRPRDALKVVGSWTHFPMPGAEVVAEIMAGEAVGKIIDLDKPVDVAVLSDPGRRSLMPQWAVSAAVTSLDDAKTAFSERYKLLAGENGALVIEGLGGPAGGDDQGDDSGRTCELAPSVGDAPTRLVCGPTDTAVRALAPYLTRTSPRTSVSSDLHVELRLAPLKAFAMLARTQLPSILRGIGLNRTRDAALADLVDAATSELIDFVGDIDRVTADAKLEDAQAGVTLSTTFTTVNSVSAHILTSHPDRVDLPPSAFWKLPNDSDVAVYQRGFDPNEIQRPRDLLLKALGASMIRDGLPEADSKTLTDTLAKMLSGAPLVVGRGVDAAAVQHALTVVSGAKDDAAREEAMLAAREPLMGWWVLGVEEPASRWQANAKDLVLGWNQPAVAKWLKEQAGSVPPPTLKISPELAAQLPKDTSRLELTFYEPVSPVMPARPANAPKGAPPPKPRSQPPHPGKLDVLIVPDGARTWLVFAGSEQDAVAKARTVTGSAPSATLATRSGLESMKDVRSSSGGFLSLRGLATLSPDVLERARRPRSSDAAAALLSSGQGETPVPLSVTALPGSSESPPGSVTVAGRVPRAAIEDLVRIIMRGGRI